MASRTEDGSRSGMPGWAKWLITLVAIMLIVAGVSVYYTLNPPQQDGQLSPEAAPSAAPPSPSDGEGADGMGVVTGCFVGPEDSTRALLAAQEKAPHTTAGAVELATQLVKWAGQAPSPTAEGAQRVDASVVSDAAGGSIPSFERAVRESTETDEVPYSTSVEQGKYFVLSQAPDKVEVSIYAGKILDGEETPMASVFGTYTMVWENDVWRLAGIESAQSGQQIADTGTPFVGGC